MNTGRIIVAALVFVTAKAGAAPFDRPVYPVEQGNESYTDGRYEDALEKYEGVEEQLAGETRLQFNRGDALYKLQRFKEAREAYLKATGTNDPELKKRNYYNIGNTFFAENAFTDAIDYYRRALEIDPGFEDARYNLELAVRALKQQKEQQDKNKQDSQNDQKNDQGKDKDQQQGDNKDNKDKNDQQKQDQEQKQGQQQDQKQDQKQSDQQANQQQNDQQQQNQPDANQPQEQKPGSEEKQPKDTLSQMQVNDLLDAARENEKPFQLYRFQEQEMKAKSRKVEKDW